MSHRKVQFPVLITTVLVLAACGGGTTPAPSTPTSSPPSEEAPSSTADASAGTTDWQDLALWDSVSGSIVHWSQSGGVSDESWQATHIDPFEELTGAEVALEFYCCSLDRLQGQVESGSVDWSIAIASTEGQLLQGIDAGLFQKLDRDTIPVDLLEDSAHNEYGISNGVYGSVITWNTDVWPVGEGPTDATDVFDTERFPGKRCLMESINLGGTLEVALLADGVAPADLYPLDVERALAKLDTIRDDIVWWSSGAESVQLILDGECDLGLAWNGRSYERVTQEGAPLAIAWQNAILNAPWLAIPVDAPNIDLATGYLAHLVYDVDGLVEHAERIGYTTAVKGIYERFDADTRSFMAVGPNLEAGIFEDAEYYRDNIVTLTERFNSWLVDGA